jgi:hypothetical protein
VVYGEGRAPVTQPWNPHGAVDDSSIDIMSSYSTSNGEWWMQSRASRTSVDKNLEEDSYNVDESPPVKIQMMDASIETDIVSEEEIETTTLDSYSDKNIDEIPKDNSTDPAEDPSEESSEDWFNSGVQMNWGQEDGAEDSVDYSNKDWYNSPPDSDFFSEK